MKFRTPFKPELLERPVVDCQGHADPHDPENEWNSMTQQHFKDECDVNLIIKRHEETGLWANTLAPATREPIFGDFSDVPDYQTAQDMLIDAQDMFMSLPSSIRKLFDNNAMAFVDFYMNPENEDKLIELGLLPPAEEPVVPVVETKKEAPEKGAAQ